MDEGAVIRILQGHIPERNKKERKRRTQHEKEVSCCTIVMFFCLDCLAQAFDITREDIEKKIVYFKETGCTLFQ